LQADDQQQEPIHNFVDSNFGSYMRCF